MKTTVVCDECDRRFVVTVDENTKQYVQDVLEELGWFEKENGTWICPACCGG